ncbi:hypothetical protein CV044_13120 [Achromobacter ruhlandii]|nr:hypothetical protein CV044_13120 [Achromobacter ruhlandii]
MRSLDESRAELSDDVTLGVSDDVSAEREDVESCAQFCVVFANSGKVQLRSQPAPLEDLLCS